MIIAQRPDAALRLGQRQEFVPHGFEFGARRGGNAGAVDIGPEPAWQQIDLDHLGSDIIGRNLIGASAVKFDFRWPITRRHIRQNRHGFQHRLAHVGALQHHAAIDVAAQILHHRETPGEIEGLGAGGRIARRDQLRIDGDDGADIFSQMGNGAIGQAVLHRRAIGLCRHVHQDRGLTGEMQGLIAPERGVTFEKAAFGAVPARGAKKPIDRIVACHGLLPGSRCRDRGVAMIARSAQTDEKPILQLPIEHLFRPLDHQYMGFQQILEAELFQLLPGHYPVEIGVSDRNPCLVIGLHEGESRARNIEGPTWCQGTDEGARESRFAGSKIAPQQNGHAGSGKQRKLGGIGFKAGSRRKFQFELLRHQASLRSSGGDASLRREIDGPSTGKVQRTVVP